MIRPMLALVAALALAGGAEAAQKHGAACNRACLAGTMTAYLDAMVKHDANARIFAKDARFTEDDVDMKLGEGGLWKDVSALGPYRQDVIDVRAGISGAYLTAVEAGKPVLVDVRLKVVDRKITEIETLVVRDIKEAGLFDPNALTKPHDVMLYKPKKSERNTRQELIEISQKYPAGLRAGTFADTPIAPDAYRNENGVFTAGKDCKLPRGGCQNMKTQPIGEGRTNFQERIVAVDEDMGVVWYRVSWKRPPGPEGPRRFVAFEAFKIYGGEIHAAEAFLKFRPLATRSAWG